MKKQEDDFLLDDNDCDWSYCDLEDCDFDNDDYCYECTGYGDDYGVDENGELVCNCDDCPYNPINSDDD